jgi:hypothetical protein
MYFDYFPVNVSKPPQLGKAIPAQDYYRPREQQEVEDPMIFRRSALEGSNFVNLTHRPPLTQEIFLVFSSVRA